MTSYWNGSAWVDFVSPSTTVSATVSATINDNLGQPKRAIIRISNQSDNPYANSGANSKGPYTGVLGDFTPIKMRDGDTNEVIFYGFADKTNETYEQGVGMLIDIEAVDHLALLMYSRTDNAYSYNINTSAAETASVRNSDTKDDDKKEWTKDISTRSGLIKSLLNQFGRGIDHPSSTDSDVADTTRFTESVKKFTENSVYNLSDRGKKPVLFHISNASEKDPHSASGDQNYGYDYYLDANITNFNTNQRPNPYFNYFKRATRPATNPATYGLSVVLPNPDDTSGGSFSQTGQKIAMTEYEFKRPKSDVYSEADVEFVATVGEDNKTVGMSAKFELITIQNTTNVASFVWSSKELGGGVAGTDSAEYLKVAIATLDGAIASNSTTTFNLNENVANDLYVGQKLSVDDNEIMTVNSITNGTTISVNRSQAGTVADGGFSDGATLYVRDVARIQYVSSTSNVTGSNTINTLISDIDKSLTEDLDNVIWTTGANSKVWTGQTTTGSNFKLNGRPRITLGVKKTVNISNDNEIKNAVREEIASALIRNTTQTVEAEFKTYETPKFYFDNSPSSLSGTNANAANPYEVTLANSVNPQAYGFKAGMVVVKLDSSGTPTSTYGYASDTSATTVDVYMNGTITTSDTLRFIVPVRAGDIIQVRNDLVNFNGYMLVTNIDTDMSSGVNLTRFMALGSEDATEAAYGKASAVKRISNIVSTDHAKPPNLPFAANPGEAITTCVFTSSAANQVDWTAGRITVNGNVYNVTAGNTGALNADGREYYVYIKQGDTAFTTVEIDSFVPDEKTLIVAHVKYTSPTAFFSVICREMNFKYLGNIQKNSVSSQLQKKGTQPWSTSVVFSGSDYDTFSWASGALSFTDGDEESINSGTRNMLNAVEYVYKLVGDSASATLQVTATYSDVFDDDKVLLATVVRESSPAGSPTILPFNGNKLTISAGAIAANSITAGNIQAGTITATEIASNTITTGQLNFAPMEADGDHTGGTVGGWKLNATNIYSGSSPVTSGYSSGNDITLTSAGTIHAKQFYIDSSGNANFKGTVNIGGTDLTTTNTLNTNTTKSDVGLSNVDNNSTATIRATAAAVSGSLAGWTINSTSIEANNGLLYLNNGGTIAGYTSSVSNANLKYIIGTGTTAFTVYGSSNTNPGIKFETAYNSGTFGYISGDSIDSTSDLRYDARNHVYRNFGDTAPGYLVGTYVIDMDNVGNDAFVQMSSTSATGLSQTVADFYVRTTGTAQYLYLGGGGSDDRLKLAGAAIYVNNDFIPKTNNTWDIGSSSYRFNTIYSVNALNTSSDATLKENMTTLSDGLDVVSSLNPIKYNRIGETTTRFGFTAQAIKDVMIAKGYGTDVAVYSERYDENTGGTSWGMQSTELIGHLVASIKELKARIETLEGG